MEILKFAFYLVVWIGWGSIAYDTWVALEGASVSLRIFATYACISVLLQNVVEYLEGIGRRP
jgi:hypothetical protein